MEFRKDPSILEQSSSHLEVQQDTFGVLAILEPGFAASFVDVIKPIFFCLRRDEALSLGIREVFVP